MADDETQVVEILLNLVLCLKLSIVIMFTDKIGVGTETSYDFYTATRQTSDGFIILGST